MEFSTKAIHVGSEPDLGEGGTGDVTVPIHMSSTFARASADRPTGGYEYSRTGNPTRNALERCLAALEGGHGALAYSSGLAAELNALHLLKKGDRVVACDDLYGGTRRLFEQVLSGFGLEFEFMDMREPAEVEKRAKGAAMLWLESPSNPLLKLADIREISKIGREQGTITVVDNTFASPCFQNPLALGADLALHSTTKYIAGHSDVVGGAIVARAAGLYERLKFLQNALGAVPSPFDCWLVHRGVKTLEVRMKKHERNAFAVARFLEAHAKVKRVFYPGLSSHPQHELARRQMTGFSGMVTVELNASYVETRRIIESTRIFALAESLGGVESLIEHPASMTHAGIPEAQRRQLGIGSSLVRLSVGLEASEDLKEDLEQALG